MKKLDQKWFNQEASAEVDILGATLIDWDLQYQAELQFSCPGRI